MTTETAQLTNETRGWQRWTDPRSLRASFGSGLLGGLCCIASAFTTAAGLGAAGFFTGLMDRYQLYFILGGVVIMAIWLLQHLRRRGIAPQGVRAVLREVGHHAIAMGIVYVLTLGIAMAVARLFQL
jgi:hypothetical protein